MLKTMPTDFRIRPLLVAGALAALAAVHAPAIARPDRAHDCKAQGTDVACTAQGVIKGVVEHNSVAFKGIPYAQAPVGALRWQAPGAPQPWTGLRDGSRFGAVCPQLAGNEVVGDEDCLTLNVWKPKDAHRQALPVMVFFTGGGNHSYSGQGTSGFGGVQYNGHKLNAEGVVFVSFNYRLGALGFLAHPTLSAERPSNVSGNYGSLDQIAMLRWVQQNIAAFGGDPRRVMVFGTSAGGGNICALMTTPAAKGLFQRAAMQSSVPTGCELPTLAQAQAGTGARVAQELGCSTSATSACLRSKSAAEVVRALPGTFGVLPRLYGPNVDGHVFPAQPSKVIERGGHAAMPVIIGNSAQETLQFVESVGPITDVPSYEAAVARVFGEQAAARILAAYPPANYPSPKRALIQLTTDGLFTCQSRRVAQLLSAHQKAPVYRYFFDHRLENDPVLRDLEAVHTIEHPFFFSWQGTYQPTGADLSVQQAMVSRWTQLASNGRLPSAGSRAWPPAWPGDRFLLLQAGPEINAGDGGAQCHLWDTVTLPQPHL